MAPIAELFTELAKKLVSFTTQRANIGPGECAVPAQESLDGRRASTKLAEGLGEDAEQPGGMQKWCEGSEAELDTPSSLLQTHHLNSLGSIFPLNL